MPSLTDIFTLYITFLDGRTTILYRITGHEVVNYLVDRGDEKDHPKTKIDQLTGQKLTA